MRKSIVKIFTRNCKKNKHLQHQPDNSGSVSEDFTEPCKIENDLDGEKPVSRSKSVVIKPSSREKTSVAEAAKLLVPSSNGVATENGVAVPASQGNTTKESKPESPSTATMTTSSSPPTTSESHTPAASAVSVEHHHHHHHHHDNKHLMPVVKSYDQIPVLEQTKLPRGGVSVDTKAVGRVQFGIPPETIKDSMKLGIPVPQVYIVPVERFCREMGPALGVNLAEFEFPAYFNFFVYKKRCTLVVDSEDAEENICRVFSETLLGPAQFRREDNPITHEPEDFDPDFPQDMIPDFQKEFKHFRIMPDGKELVIETLLDFCHFKNEPEGHSTLGIPPSGDDSDDSVGDIQGLDSLDDDAPDKEEQVPTDENAMERRESKQAWTYSQTRFMGDVAVVWPPNATEEQKKARSVPRVEIFKMPGGTEYVIHDVDVNNIIIGRARLSGHVKVSENLRVDGFGGLNILDDLRPKIKIRSKKEADNGNDDTETSVNSESLTTLIPREVPPPTFHPPSFGVTVLGNSHGFDSSGSVSGYVLWINGRGVMIDPPPYSSATLEREGIRPRTIVGIIITHCHADHDAGTFQKILTGSPIVVITTPTIYKSFIRKYAALSALSPALLRHCHRYKPAIIGQPLRFQGATFHFTYSLHTIPCVGFRVEWRGKSIVFSADHYHKPSAMEMLRETGVLSQGRTDDLLNIPMQHTDLLLHESGAPPIHTPLDELMKLPLHVKKRMYVVHTAKLPDDCDLRAAPTGTAGTIRLDEHLYGSKTSLLGKGNSSLLLQQSIQVGEESFRAYVGQGEYDTIDEDSEHSSTPSSGRHNHKGRTSMIVSSSLQGPPLVALRPSSSTDAWFTLNLLSAVPFVSSLSYNSTMELLETARVDAYRQNDIIIPASRRSEVLCVVWEGTCAEKPADSSASQEQSVTAVWHAGDWTGPLVLQPDRKLSGESKNSAYHDVVAVSLEGVKVITIEFSNLDTILNNGSSLYKKYQERRRQQEKAMTDIASIHEAQASTTNNSLVKAKKELNVLELLNCNSALRKLNAVQKRHLESLAEGPVSFQPNERLWQAGAPVDRAFIIVSGSASFHVRRNPGGSKGIHDTSLSELSDHVGDSMRADAIKVIKDLDKYAMGHHHGVVDDYSDMSSVESDMNRGFPLELFGTSATPGGHDAESKDFEIVQRGLTARARFLAKDGSVESDASVGDESIEHDSDPNLPHIFTDDDTGSRNRRSTAVLKRRGSRARFANKILGRLYNRRAFTSGLVFSRGHFLGDVSKMVAGLLSADELHHHGEHSEKDDEEDNESPHYGFGDKAEVDDKKIVDLTIHEKEGDELILHSSTLSAGKDGCVVLVFPKSALIPLLDEYPGFLLSLLGTQVVV